MSLAALLVVEVGPRCEEFEQDKQKCSCHTFHNSVLWSVYLDVALRRVQANRIGKINLAATGRDLMEEDKAGDVTIDLYAALEMEAEAVAERSQELLINQKLGLLNGFLSVDNWYSGCL